jgi:hypothetical protein
VTGDYLRSMKHAGIRGTMDDYVQLRALGVTARDARGIDRNLTAEKLIKLKEGDWEDDEPPAPPQPPEVDDPDPDPDE